MLRKGQRRRRKRLLYKLLGLLVAMPLHAELKVLKNFTLIDGRGGPPVSGAALIMDNGRIQWVGSAAQLQATVSAEVIDLSGKYVMPGIIDLHVHLGATVDLDQRADLLTEANTKKDLRT